MIGDGALLLDSRVTEEHEEKAGRGWWVFFEAPQRGEGKTELGCRPSGLPLTRAGQLLYAYVSEFSIQGLLELNIT